MSFKLGGIPWNKNLTGVQSAWNKGIKYLLPETKFCKGCKMVLSSEKFGRKGPGRQLGQLRTYCLICGPKQSEKWRRENPERHLENFRNWARNNRSYINESRRDRLASDPQFKIACALRNRFSGFLRKGAPKNGSTLKLFGAPLLEVQQHLEGLFKLGMTWGNHGSVWEIDHVRPCASFDLTDPEQQKLCFHFSNIQPLFVLENRKKGGRV